MGTSPHAADIMRLTADTIQQRVLEESFHSMSLKERCALMRSESNELLELPSSPIQTRERSESYSRRTRGHS